MSDILLLKRNFNTNQCKLLVEDIQFNRNKYYYFLGKSSSQITEDIEDIINSENATRSEMVTFSRISESDISYVIRRVDWTANTIYAQYDSTVDLADLDYYVMTPEFNVYKCINNNLNAESTVMPSETSMSMFTTADGYTWKYMYNVPLYKRNKFISVLKIPVQTALSDRFYNSGAISSINVKKSGSGYLPGGTNNIIIFGDGVDAAAVPVINTNGTLEAIEITNAGTGYTYATAQIESAEGIDGELEVFLAANDFTSDQSNIEQTSVDGGIHNIVITSQGSNYTIAQVDVSGDGTGCTATANIIGGFIRSITVTNPGSGYSHATITITGNNIDNNPGATHAAAYPIISPMGGHGRDAVTELGATGVCLFSNIRNESLYLLNQDFREYGIIKNIRDLYSNNIISMRAGSFTHTVILNNTSELVLDEILMVGTGKFRVVNVFPASNTVILNSVNNSALGLNSVLVALNNINHTYLVTSIPTGGTPNGNKFSGQVLLVADSDAFTFSAEQEVIIKTYINL
jgi:hypothetical protein